MLLSAAEQRKTFDNGKKKDREKEKVYSII